MPEGRFPIRQELDAASPNNPVSINFGAHITIANSKALELAGINKSTDAPAGGAIEIDEGGSETPLLRKLAPPGQRYLLVQLRDTFKPLFTDQGPVADTKSRSLSRARRFGNELESIPPIALYVMRKIEKKQPELFKKIKHYERLFNNKKDLEAMDDDDAFGEMLDEAHRYASNRRLEEEGRKEGGHAHNVEMPQGLWNEWWNADAVHYGKGWGQ